METTRAQARCAGQLAERGGAGGEAVLRLYVFLDSSALAKRYIEEAGSERVEQILLSATSLGLSVLCLPEIISALSLRRRERRLTASQYGSAKRALLQDVGDSSIINLTDKVVARATELLEPWPLRSSDSIQVASAAEWATDVFISADERQCAAARAYGLQVQELRIGPAV